MITSAILEQTRQGGFAFRADGDFDAYTSHATGPQRSTQLNNVGNAAFILDNRYLLTFGLPGTGTF